MVMTPSGGEDNPGCHLKDIIGGKRGWTREWVIKPAQGPGGNGRNQRQGSQRRRGRWSDLELQEGKPQSKRGGLVSSRGPESPGPPNTGAEERGRGHH